MTYQRSLLALLYFALALVLCVSACSPNESSGGGSDGANTGDDDTGGDDDDDDLVDDDGTSPPQSPSNLEGQADGLWAIDLTWKFNSGNEEGFNLQRKTVDGAFETIASIGAGEDSYKDSGLDCETRYIYQILAYNEYGESQPSNEANVTTGGPCIIEPPSDLEATNQLVGEINLHWEDNSNYETGYLIFRQEVSTREWVEIARIPENSTDYTDQINECLPVQRTFEYRVQGYNDAIASDWSNIASGTAICPIARPTQLSAELMDDYTVKLTWTNNATNQNGFRILRNGNLIGATGADEFEYFDSSVICEENPQYTVVAFHEHLVSDISNTASCRTFTCSPFIVSANQDGVSAINLVWTDLTNQENGYEVQRQASARQWETIATLSANTTTYTDTAVECNFGYEYRARATTANRPSPWSNEKNGEMVGCIISEECYANNEGNPDNDCLVCKTGQNLSDWIINDGEACNDGIWCNGGDFCVSDECIVHTGDPCGSDRQCNETGRFCATGGAELDIALLSSDDSKVALYSVYENGEINALIKQVIDFWLEFFTLADFNEDGYMDIAATNSNYFYVLLNDGKGVFSLAQQYEAITPAIVVEDINNDGHNDIAVLGGENYSEELRIFLGNGDGAFQEPWSQMLSVYFQTTMTSGDFNNDGNIDLAYGNDSEMAVGISLGNGDGTFTDGAGPGLSDGSPNNIKVADINSDDNDDIFGTSGYYGYRYFVSLGNGDGSFNAPIETVLNDEDCVGLIDSGDFNNDSQPDLFIQINDHDQSGNYFYLQGNGDGSFQDAVEFEDPGWHFAIGDINGDLNQDFVIANSTPPEPKGLTYYFGNGDGTFQEPINIYGDYDDEYKFLALGDINNDLHLDTIATDDENYSLSTLMGRADGAFPESSEYVVGSRAKDVKIGDFNGDGRLDIVTANYSSNTISILMNKGNRDFDTPVDYYSGQSTQSVAVADFNGDTNLDIATVNNLTNDASVFLNNGDGTFQNAVYYSVFESPQKIYTGEFNGDDIIDLLAISSNHLSFSLLYGNGDGTFGAENLIVTGATNNCAQIEDVNNDGNKDIVSVQRNADKVSVRLTNGDGTFTWKGDYTTGTSPWNAVVANFNGDFASDIVTANQESEDVSLLIGRGDGTFEPAISIFVGGQPTSLAFADVNADNALDLLVGDEENHTLTILKGNGDGTFAYPIKYIVCNAPIAVVVAYFGGTP